MLKVVSNASPLIGLSRINQLHLLKKLWEKIVIPDAVYKEAVTDGAGKFGAKSISEACQDWITCALKYGIPEWLKIPSVRA